MQVIKQFVDIMVQHLICVICVQFMDFTCFIQFMNILQIQPFRCQICVFCMLVWCMLCMLRCRCWCIMQIHVCVIQVIQVQLCVSQVQIHVHIMQVHIMHVMCVICVSHPGRCIMHAHNICIHTCRCLHIIRVRIMHENMMSCSCLAIFTISLICGHFMQFKGFWQIVAFFKFS